MIRHQKSANNPPAVSVLEVFPHIDVAAPRRFGVYSRVSSNTAEVNEPLEIPAVRVFYRSVAQSPARHPLRICSMIATTKAGKSSGVRLVMMFPSMHTS